jgi:hypothetical protein
MHIPDYPHSDVRDLVIILTLNHPNQNLRLPGTSAKVGCAP